MSTHSLLRAATDNNHAAVDEAFSAYDLSEVWSYREFLTVHAAALIPLEQKLSSSVVVLPRRISRMPLLKADLRFLRSRLPTPPPIVEDFSAAMLHGVLYVVEGSRLGGRVLSQRVGTGLPKAYLCATHAKGEWRSFLGAFDAAADISSSSWLDEAVTGAKFAFDHFLRSAAGDTFNALREITAKPLQSAQ